MAKKINTIQSFDMFSYESFCVYEVLSKDPKNAKASFKGMENVDGFAYPPDIYAPEGIPSMEIVGKTVIEVKKNLSFSAFNEFKPYIDTHIGQYNIVVVYFRSTLSSEPEQLSMGGKTVKYISFNELKGKKSTKPQDKFYSDKVRSLDWKEERKSIIGRFY